QAMLDDLPRAARLREQVEVVAAGVAVAEERQAADLDASQPRGLDENRKQADETPALAHAERGQVAAFAEVLPPRLQPLRAQEHVPAARAQVQIPPFLGAGCADRRLGREHLDHARLAHRKSSRTQLATCSA